MGNRKVFSAIFKTHVDEIMHETFSNQLSKEFATSENDGDHFVD